ncbi:MAG: hypothetical protein B0A82_26045 [Alkalinema sp. CACIAM 70d]|nr:MAG: hypothetical protein B0A82_26045 [Alkalinema sp. CACIAM 70d]
MIYLPIIGLLFILLLLLLPILWFTVTLEVVQIAAVKLGFSPMVGGLMLVLVILGSTINIPLYKTESKVDLLEDWIFFHQRQYWGIPFHRVPQITIVALNVGGCVLPSLLALYQFHQAPAGPILLVTAIVTIVSYYAAHIVPGIGIQMNPLLAPITAALSAIALGQPHTPAIAFAGGILGVLIGADLLHLKDIESMSSGILSIGGAGVFDGILLCGLFSVLLA